MAGWLTVGRGQTRRIEALEREIHALATRAAACDDRIEAVSADVRSLIDRDATASASLPLLRARIEALEGELHALGTASSLQTDRLEALGETGGALAGEHASFAATLSALEARLDGDHADLMRLQRSMAADMEAEFERLRDLSTTVGALAEAMAALEAAKSAEAILALQERLEADQAERVKTRTAMMRIERQLNLYVDEARKIGAGLLERIETSRGT